MKKQLKKIALSLALLISMSSVTAFATTTDVFTSDLELYETIPPIDGIEDIVSQDTVWKYGVTQPTTVGVLGNIISAALGMSGVAMFSNNTAKNYLAGALANFTYNSIFTTHNTVNIKFNRYHVRGADGKIRYKVYATYYQLNGSFIASKLCQSGVV